LGLVGGWALRRRGWAWVVGVGRVVGEVCIVSWLYYA